MHTWPQSNTPTVDSYSTISFQALYAACTILIRPIPRVLRNAWTHSAKVDQILMADEVAVNKGKECEQLNKSMWSIITTTNLKFQSNSLIQDS